MNKTLYHHKSPDRERPLLTETTRLISSLLSDDSSSCSSSDLSSLTDDEDHEHCCAEDSPTPKSAIWGVLPTLLLGVFVAQADASIVIATSQQIASEFEALSEAAWLVTTYALAQAACQPLYGKTSDIFGRKALILFSYIVFAFGCVLCGAGTSYWHVLAGRSISGIGGAGMVGLVAIIVADLVPPRDVASMRGYVNVVATLGRSCGGPAGGWLVENIGWRWCFLAQGPLALLAGVLIAWKLSSFEASVGDNWEDDTTDKGSFGQMFKRLDIYGFLTLPLALVTAFIALDLAGKFYPWFYVTPLAVAALGMFLLFWYIEKHCAVEPIIPIQLVARRDAWSTFLIIGLQTAGQFTLTFTIPIYFQLVARESVTVAGSHIVIIVLGNSLSGLATGWLVGRTGYYKILTVISTTLGAACYATVLVRWHGASGWTDTWYLIFAGLGLGASQNTTFVHLTASLQPEGLAIASTLWFLSQNIGNLVSTNIFSLVHNTALVKLLSEALDGVENKDDIIDGCLSSVQYILTLPESLSGRVSGAFIESLIPTNGYALGCGIAAVLMSLLMRERPLDVKGG